ncbi:helix-turn-helix domain-containing protein [Spongiimicrobium salis]|uniref:helix-turn-helix domain-containing protein n=1 Tax=Spongiimicrobium salis TaxID=1667022 RepID=UPI00374D02C6
MNDIGLASSIGIITVFIAFLLALFLFTLKTDKKLGNRLFAFFLILIALDISGWAFPEVLDTNSNLTLIKSNLIFLQLPVFYLHILAMSYIDFKLKTKHLLHAVPFVIANIILIPRYYSVDASAKMEFLKRSKEMWEIQFFHIFIHLQIALYLIIIFLLLQKIHKIYLENYTNSDTKSYSWLFNITVFLALFHGLALLKNIFKFSTYEAVTEWIKITLGVAELLILCWYLFKALQHPELFRSVDSKLQLVDNMLDEEKKVIEVEDQKTIDRLRDHMEKEAPFLDPSLTSKNLADALQLPVKELSILINHKIGMHFFDFVNEYRIKKAMEILENTAKSELTILEILYEVGFNSKSSFNTSFKKYTGLTPTVYRKQLQNQQINQKSNVS